MAGLTHLSDFLVKKGKDFVNNLLSNDVTITEKLDGSNFNVRKIKNGFEYYKRDGKIPISNIDRLLSIYHEKPIEHFDLLPQEIKDSIPIDTYFSLEYFASNQPVSVYYNEIPESGLVLETVKLKNGKYVYDKKELNKWADLLKVDRVPIIFQGKLSKTQKKKLIEFLATPFNDLIEKYSSQSFSRFIISLINPTLKTTFLKSSLDDIIEGVVFNFKGENESTFAKIVDPLFTQMAKKKVLNKRQTSNDIYGMAVSDITDYISDENLNDYTLSGNTFSEKYIDLMSQLFLDYFSIKGQDYKDINFNVPDFLSKPEHSINLKNIKYKDIKKIIRENKNYLELYRIFLATFRKKKKRAYGYFTKDFIALFNVIVDKILNYINSTINEITYTDIQTFALINEEDYIIERYNIIDEINDTTIIEIPQYLQNDVVDESELITEPAKIPINVVVGRFQPIHRGHIAISKFLKSANSYDSIYIAIRSKKPNIKSPISLDLQKRIFNTVSKNEPTIIEFYESNRVLFNEIFTLLRSKGYEPMSLGAGEDRKETYEEQLNFMLVKRNNMMNVNPDFEIISIPRNIIKVSGTSVRNSIINNDEETYINSMPKYLYKYYDELQKELVQTLTVNGKINLKLSKADSPGLYKINYNKEKDESIIYFNPILIDTITKKLK